MGLLVVADTPAKHVERPDARSWRWMQWLIPLLYVLIAVFLTWRVWASPSTMQPTNGGQIVAPDMYLNDWFMRYVATAISHGHLPALVTRAVNFPQGINVMWNTSLLLPGILLTPLTLLAGPLVSLAVLMTVGFAGSAATMMYVLRRWGASVGAAAIGGAVYGFSPALMVAANDHYHLQFAVLLPLIVDAALLLATGRGRLVRTAIWLGLLVAAQMFIAEELLVDTALACAVFVFVLAVSRPSRVLAALRKPEAALDRIAATIGGLAITGLVVLLICGRALWVQLHGPLTEHGTPFHMAKYGEKPPNFVTAPNAMYFHGQYWPFIKRTGQFLVEVYGYLGWPLLILLAVIIIAFWRDPRVRVAGLSFAIIEWFSMGGHRVRVHGFVFPAQLMPWHYLWHMPVIGQVVPNRISILADGAAAAVLAFGFDRVRAAAPRAGTWRKPVLVLSAVAALGALLPIIPRPIPAAAISSPPAGFSVVLAKLHLKAGAPVLVLPLNGPLAMQWQATTGIPLSVAGGWCIAPNPSGRATLCDTRSTLGLYRQTVRLRMGNMITELPFDGAPPRFYPLTGGPDVKVLARALSQWRTAAVVTVVDGGTSMVARYLLTVLGPPAVRSGDVVAWRTRAAENTLHRLVTQLTQPKSG